VHDPVDVAAARAALDSASGSQTCVGEPVPQMVGALLVHARAALDRAAADQNPVHGRRFVRGALIRLKRAARRIAFLSTRGRLAPGCAAELGSRLDVATARANCLLNPAGPGPFACLAGSGPLITLRGTRTTEYNERTLAPGTRIDARAATFLGSSSANYPISLDGAGAICFAGGNVKGQYDRTLGWETMHDMNNAGVAFASPTTVDGVRVDDVTDGLRPRGRGPFTIRNVWLSYIRDDCVENDHLEGGLIEDSLFDGCYVALSERPSDTTPIDRRGDLVTIRDSLIRLQPMPGPRNGSPSDLGNGALFKWSDEATKLALHDDVFLVEQVGQDGPDTMGIPKTLASCSNNLMVWLGPGDYPAPLPSCFTVTRDRRKWDDAVARWKMTHPNVGR
jgi:hypothetical protein